MQTRNATHRTARCGRVQMVRCMAHTEVPSRVLIEPPPPPLLEHSLWNESAVGIVCLWPATLAVADNAAIIAHLSQRMRIDDSAVLYRSDYRSAPERERDAPEALVDFVVRQVVVRVELQCSKTERSTAGLSVLGFPFCTSLSAYSTKRSTLAAMARLSRGTVNGSGTSAVHATSESALLAEL
jgi:hypothetical protein